MLHHGSVVRLQNKEYKYKFYIFVYFFGTFLLFFIIKFVFSSFPFLFLMSLLTNQKQELLIKICQWNSINTTISEIHGDANSTQRYFKYYYKKEVLHNSNTFSSLFLDLNIFAQNKSRKWTKVVFFSYFRVYTNESYLYFDFLPEEGKERLEFTALDLKYFTLEM